MAKLKISFKEGELIESKEEDKKILREMKKKSITEEHAYAKDEQERIAKEIEIFAHSNKLKFEKTKNQIMVDIYGLKFFYPDFNGKLAGILECNEVQLDAVRNLLLRLSNIVSIKVREKGVDYEYYEGEKELSEDLFDSEHIDREEMG